MTRWWHGVLAAVILAALIGQGGAVLRDGSGLVDFFSYFTIQSNILVLVAALGIALDPRRSGTAWRLLRLAGLVGITVTGVVYAVAIGPSVEFDGAAWWYDKVFHTVVPVAALLGHLLFRPRTVFRRADLVFVAWPIAWLAWTLSRAELGSPSFMMPGHVYSSYPYEFLDVDERGWWAVLLACLLVTGLFLALATVFVAAGRRQRDRTGLLAG